VQDIYRIVIVGGGTAGWLSAAYLQKKLGAANRRRVVIQLVESEDVDIIGVGEATIPGFVAMMQELEIPEFRLLADADATFKNAIKFVGWSGATDEAGAPAHFFHAFDPPPVLGGQNTMVHWLALKNAGVNVEPLDIATSIGSALCAANRSPKMFSSQPYEAPVPYAYHLDARKLGQLLRTTATERGVDRVLGTVVSVDQDEDGSIAALHLKDGREIEGDLFIDCSGFRSLLIERVLASPFESFSDRLLCDRALACQVPFADASTTPRCYTTATAQSAGWTWEIDLNARSGIGYVYSSRFASDDEANITLLNHIGRPDLDLVPRMIDMKVGCRPRPWVKNCVAIGLSAGFLEPLESTAIHLAELGLRVLVDHLATSDAQEPLRDHYNALMSDAYGEVADFLVMHYVFNGRRGEPFWDYCRDNLTLPPRLIEKLRIWAWKVPSVTDIGARIKLFDGFSYMAIMAGMNALPPYGGNLSGFVDLNESAAVLDQVRELRALAVRSSPPHKEMVQKLRASA
jgi:flavin-dependent dehydrogenase